MIKITTPQLHYLAFEKLNQQPNLHHAVTLRQADPTDLTIEKTARALRLNHNSLIKPQQIHSAIIAVVRQPGENVGAVDGVCTTQKNIPLALIGADCPLIIAYDPVHQALGLAHAGWRGTVQQIAIKLLQKMKTEFDSDPRLMIAAIGPGICPNCYQVGPEVAEKFQNQFKNTENYLFKTPNIKNNISTDSDNEPPDHPKQKWQLDLAQANRAQLISEGMPKCNIEISEYCTYEHEKWFYSYRREGPKTGRIALIAGLS